MYYGNDDEGQINRYPFKDVYEDDWNRVPTTCRCPDCSGTGRHAYHGYCGRCGGTGRIERRK